MIINMLPATSVGTMTYALYPEKTQTSYDYFRDQVTNFNQSLTDSGRAFMDKSRELYDRVNSSSAIRAAKAGLAGSANLFTRDAVVEIRTLEAFKTATPLMQRYLMAEPEIRAIYHRQNCDGYADSYLDAEPGKRGEHHYDYRRVMDSIVVDEEDSWTSTTYYEDTRDGDTVIDFTRQVDVLSSWEYMRVLSALGHDPTNPFGGDIGV
jgi:hypothetical protein